MLVITIDEGSKANSNGKWTKTNLTHYFTIKTNLIVFVLNIPAYTFFSGLVREHDNLWDRVVGHALNRFCEVLITIMSLLIYNPGMKLEKKSISNTRCSWTAFTTISYLFLGDIEVISTITLKWSEIIDCLLFHYDNYDNTADRVYSEWLAQILDYLHYLTTVILPD